MTSARSALKRAGVLLLAAAAASVLATTAPASNDPIAITFQKAAVPGQPGYYRGTTGGAATGESGTIEMWVSNSSVTGQMQHFDVRIAASLANGESFAAELRGTFNFSTGNTLLTGTVTEGWLAGAQAREKGSYIGGGRFAGTLWLMPATA